MSEYTKSNISLIQHLNGLNIFATIYIFNKHHFYLALPHFNVCVSSFIFWSEPKNKIMKIIDYVTVFISLGHTYIHSLMYKRDYYITPLLMFVIYCFILSMHYKNTNRHLIYGYVTHFWITTIFQTGIFSQRIYFQTELFDERVTVLA